MRILASISLLVLLAGCGKEESTVELQQRNENAVKQLLAWNKRKLVRNAGLKKEDIAQLFAPEFVVKANGRSYDGSYENYFEFLNEFRENIVSLDYEIQEYIITKDRAVVPLRAKMVRTDESTQIFDAIMILGFNDQGKIILWQEVYAEFTEQQ